MERIVILNGNLLVESISSACPVRDGWSVFLLLKVIVEACGAFKIAQPTSSARKACHRRKKGAALSVPHKNDRRLLLRT